MGVKLTLKLIKGIEGTFFVTFRDLIPAAINLKMLAGKDKVYINTAKLLKSKNANDDLNLI